MSDAQPGAWTSSPDLLVLHTVRVMGVVDDAAVGARTDVDLHSVTGLLRDHEAYGWVTHVEFAQTGGWTLTERGRAEDVRRLTQELQDAGAQSVVKQVHLEFEPLNARLVKACTDWQLRPGDDGRLLTNDHSDPYWDTQVMEELSALGGDLVSLVDDLGNVLARFDGYHDRFDAALTNAREGHKQWVAGIGIPSCHVVWMELHEDLLSTLGIARDAQSSGGQDV